MEFRCQRTDTHSHPPSLYRKGNEHQKKYRKKERDFADITRFSAFQKESESPSLLLPINFSTLGFRPFYLAAQPCTRKWKSARPPRFPIPARKVSRKLASLFATFRRSVVDNAATATATRSTQENPLIRKDGRSTVLGGDNYIDWRAQPIPGKSGNN